MAEVEFTKIKKLVDVLHSSLTAAQEAVNEFNELMGGEFKIVANISFDKVLRKTLNKEHVVADEPESAEEAFEESFEECDCPECEGTGFDPKPKGSHDCACSVCGGTGIMEVE
jgi:hypothetical protein